ncbi:MAG: S24/S26 family peptidase [Erysipelotrichaceae bacterium]|nr:S24/S26 family peptidase [Erysipelotrichaceae bacterium]
MSTSVKLSDSLPVLLAVLESGKTFSYVPNGNSMMPLIRSGRDTVVFSAMKELRVGDIYLFRKGSAIILHRLIDASEEGSLTFLGDGNYIPEKGIRKEDVLAVVVKLVRDGKEVDFSAPFYRKYSDIMVRADSRSRKVIGKIRGLQQRGARVLSRFGLYGNSREHSET